MKREHWQQLLRHAPAIYTTANGLMEPPDWGPYLLTGGNPKTPGEWQARRMANRGVAIRFDLDRVRAMEPPKREDGNPADLAEEWARIQAESGRLRR